MLLLIETCLTALVVLFALASPPRVGHSFERAEHQLRGFAARRGQAIVAVFLLAIAARLAVLPVEPIPQPGIHDEYSYLLMADTFAHGRLTNPTHPMWEHFETLFVNQRPTYCSMYYPAQGLFLAFGQVVFGHPFWGVVLSTALMCAALCWALQAWVPPAWALLASILAIMRLGTFSYWADSYWGGSVAAIGGALVIGAFPRLRRRQRARDALVMGLGVAILANSRPYEMLFLVVPVLIALSAGLLRSRTITRVSLVRVALPLAGVFAMTVAAMAYYFWRTTGNPVRTPYFVNLQTYFVVPNFPWLPLRAMPVYRHASMREMYAGFPVRMYYIARHRPFFLTSLKLLRFWLFFIGPLFTAPILAWATVRPPRWLASRCDRKLRFLTLLCGISAVGLALPVPFHAHYAAPILAAMCIIFVQMLRYVSHWRFDSRPSGVFFVRGVVLACFLLVLFRAIAPALSVRIPWTTYYTWSSSTNQNLERDEIIKQLNRIQGDQLIFVRYGHDHNAHEEWVYNSANIDTAKLVWAREMGPQPDEELLKYFSSRKAWLLEPDYTPPKITPYPLPSEMAADR